MLKCILVSMINGQITGLSKTKLNGKSVLVGITSSMRKKSV